MNIEDLKYYKLISRIQSAIGKSASYYDAIRNGIRVIAEHSCADYAVVWSLENGTLHPYYWLSPVDLTSAALSADADLVREVLGDGKTVFLADFPSEAPEDLRQKLRGIPIRSLVAVPFSFGGTDRGIVFYVSAEKGFCDDDVSVFEILSMLTEMSLGETQLSFRPWQEKKPVMTCRSICKSFQNGESVTEVLKGVNFDVFEGEFLCILGESGCGKSTFLNIIGGLEKADSGTFDFYGKAYQDASEDELTEYRRKNIGFVFQSYHLMPNLTGKQNLDLIGELAEDPLDAAEALAMVGLGDKADSYPAQLSGGQQQRVSIARALVKRPKIIMADEPTAALDYRTSIEVLAVLDKVVKNGTTLIMVTHNEEIARMADRVVRLRDGKVYEVTVNRNPKKVTELVW